jgi:hypothetical protein
MYNYQEYSPDIRLTPWVKNYWWSDGFVSSEVTPKVFPDGCTDIMFIFNKVTGTSFSGIFGTMTKFVNVDFPAFTQMFGIRFRPAGLSASGFITKYLEFSLFGVMTIVTLRSKLRKE